MAAVPARVPQTKAGWESKIQAQVEDLERREGALQAQQNRVTRLQQHAEELAQRHEALKLREVDLTALEARYRVAVDDEARVRQREADVEHREAALQSRIAQHDNDQNRFAEDTEATAAGFRNDSAVLEARRTMLDVFESRLVREEQSLLERSARSEAQLEALRSQALAVRTHFIAGTKTVDAMHADLKNREEVLSHKERLFKELQEADDRARRTLRGADQELKRRAAVLAVAEAAAEADREVLREQREEFAADALALDRRKQEYDARLASIDKRERDASRREAGLRELRARIDLELEALRRRQNEVADGEVKALQQRHDLDRACHVAECDMATAKLLAARAEALRLVLSSREKDLAKQRAELQRWNAELSWREELVCAQTRSALTMESMRMDSAADSVSASLSNPGASGGGERVRREPPLQEHKLRTLYEASIVRRSSRASELLSGRAVTRPPKRPASASATSVVTRPGTPGPRAFEATPAIGVPTTKEVMDSASRLAVDFHRVLARALTNAAQESPPTDNRAVVPWTDENTLTTVHRALAAHLPVETLVAVMGCLNREHDAAQELQLLHHLINMSADPMALETARALAVKRMHQLCARRVDALSCAIDALSRRSEPEAASTPGAGRHGRALPPGTVGGRDPTPSRRPRTAPLGLVSLQGAAAQRTALLLS